MAYEPYEWKAKDNITTARLNHIEQGIAAGGGAMVVTTELSDDLPPTSITFPMTWKEVNEAITAGITVIFKTKTPSNYITTSIVVTSGGGDEYMLIVMGNELNTFYATSENDYPVWDKNNS